MALPNKTKIPVGTVLAGKYRITREIGRGGMAAVYEAANVDIGKRVAIKVLAQELTTSAIVVERFLREARAAAAIRSPYICDIYDSGKLDDGRPFLVLELLEGESLYERMTKIRWMDPESTVAIMAQTCRGLTKAHAAQIVHRDLKPENIFLTKDEEGKLCAKILDFGLAKFYAPMDGKGPQARLTREGAVFGTPAYMSPEQVRGQGAVDHRADLWALGCIVYECFTGRTVWSTEQGVAMTFAQIANAPLPRPSTYRPDLPASFTTWFDKALNRDIEVRFQTAKEFADELAITFAQPIGSIAGSMHDGNPSSAGIPFTPSSVLTPPASAAVPSPRVPEAPPPPSPDTGPSSTQPNAGQAGPSSSLARKSASTGAVVALTAGAVLLVGGASYAVYSQLFANKPQVPAAPSASAKVVLAPASATGSASAPVNASAAPVHTAAPESPGLPWVSVLREGQGALAAGDPKGAARLFKEAYDKGSGHGVARNLMEHLTAGGGEKAPCHLTAIGRPRSYDLVSPAPRAVPATRPSIVLGPKGPVMSWTDAHEGTEHAYTVHLDDALRALEAPIDVTPEGTSIVRPEVRRAGDKIVMSYWDARGPEAGVKARFLLPNGHIGGPAVAVSPSRPGSFFPTLAQAPDGSFYAAWSDATDSESEDLFFAHLSASLEPIGAPARATELVPQGPLKPRARLPSIAIEGDSLLATFRLERDPLRVIEAMRVPLADAGKGLEPSPGKKATPRQDRNIGEMVLVNADRAKADSPELACSQTQCFVVWHGESSGGAWAASMEAGKPQAMWRKKFSRGGARPAVAMGPGGQAQVVWFENGKILTAALTRDGVLAPTKLLRVQGDQPQPVLAAGSKPGEWYLAWLDFESANREVYAARFLCK